MRLSALFSFVSFSLFLGCTSQISTRNIPLSSLLDDNSSKVWLVNKAFKNGKNISPKNLFFREVVIFYTSSKFCLQPLNSLGNKEGDKGIYELDAKERRLTLNFKYEVWYFEIASATTDKIALKPTNQSACQFELELIPLPEL
jgi:hypothetical protein